MNILQSFNLSQHVNFPTHKDGNVLDLVITRADEVLICDLGWFDPVLSDHRSVHYRLCSTKKPVFRRQKVFYRNLASIGTEIFCQDLANCDLSSKKLNDDLSSLIDKYYLSLKSVIDCQAHEKEQVCTLRPIAPWFSVDVSTEKKKRRHLERKWCTTRSDVTLIGNSKSPNVKLLTRWLSMQRRRNKQRWLMRTKETSVFSFVLLTNSYIVNPMPTFPLVVRTNCWRSNSMNSSSRIYWLYGILLWLIQINWMLRYLNL